MDLSPLSNNIGLFLPKNVMEDMYISSDDKIIFSVILSMSFENGVIQDKIETTYKIIADKLNFTTNKVVGCINNLSNNKYIEKDSYFNRDGTKTLVLSIIDYAYYNFDRYRDRLHSKKNTMFTNEDFNIPINAITLSYFNEFVLKEALEFFLSEKFNIHFSNKETIHEYFINGIIDQDINFSYQKLLEYVTKKYHKNYINKDINND